MPTIRLKSKTRVEGRIKRVYDQPCTPYERVMESEQVGRKTKQELQGIYDSLNPAELSRRLTRLRAQLEALSAGKSEGMGNPAYRGPEYPHQQPAQSRPRQRVKPRSQQAGLRPAMGLCPIPCGGSAPATRKNLPLKAGS